jgi:hypothetical protein
MKPAFLLALLVAACGEKPAAHVPTDPPPPADPTTVTLHYHPSEPGSRWERTKKASADLVIASTGTFHSDTLERATFQVLASADDGPTREQVRYDGKDEHMMMNGRAQDKADALAGKTFVIDRTSGALVVTALDGSAPSPEEVAEVTKRERSFGRGDHIGPYLAGKTFTRGQPVELPAEIVAETFADDHPSAATMTITFESKDGALARFAVKATLTGAVDGMQIKASMEGEIALDIETGDTGLMQVSGPVSYTGAMQATGTVRFEESSTRLR